MKVCEFFEIKLNFIARGQLHLPLTSRSLQITGRVYHTIPLYLDVVHPPLRNSWSALPPFNRYVFFIVPKDPQTKVLADLALYVQNLYPSNLWFRGRVDVAANVLVEAFDWVFPQAIKPLLMMLLRFLIDEENVVFLCSFIKTKISMAFDFTFWVLFWLFKRNKLDVSAPNMEILRGNREDAKSRFFPHSYDLHVLIFFIYQITKMCQDEYF
ncbi:Hypothetical predicted protein [Prunus dulcis]|uniref:Uncharacterized protein n=1 Tax=Prunus dulcis TaxID=3755 RepID=A0A5E4FL17_PRUDU|nr:Hypothetical predicted protein [Prunus dulcis]